MKNLPLIGLCIMILLAAGVSAQVYEPSQQLLDDVLATFEQVKTELEKPVPVVAVAPTPTEPAAAPTPTTPAPGAAPPTTEEKEEAPTPWYGKPGYIILIIIVIAAVSFGVFKFRRRKLKKKYAADMERLERIKRVEIHDISKQMREIHDKILEKKTAVYGLLYDAQKLKKYIALLKGYKIGWGDIKKVVLEGADEWKPEYLGIKLTKVDVKEHHKKLKDINQINVADKLPELVKSFKEQQSNSIAELLNKITELKANIEDLERRYGALNAIYGTHSTTKYEELVRKKADLTTEKDQIAAKIGELESIKQEIEQIVNELNLIYKTQNKYLEDTAVDDIEKELSKSKVVAYEVESATNAVIRKAEFIGGSFAGSPRLKIVSGTSTTEIELYKQLHDIAKRIITDKIPVDGLYAAAESVYNEVLELVNGLEALGGPVREIEAGRVTARNVQVVGEKSGEINKFADLVDGKEMEYQVSGDLLKYKFKIIGTDINNQIEIELIEVAAASGNFEALTAAQNLGRKNAAQLESELKTYTDNEIENKLKPIKEIAAKSKIEWSEFKSIMTELDSGVIKELPKDIVAAVTGLGAAKKLFFNNFYYYVTLDLVNRKVSVVTMTYTGENNVVGYADREADLGLNFEAFLNTDAQSRKIGNDITPEDRNVNYKTDSVFEHDVVGKEYKFKCPAYDSGAVIKFFAKEKNQTEEKELKGFGEFNAALHVMKFKDKGEIVKLFSVLGILEKPKKVHDIYFYVQVFDEHNTELTDKKEFAVIKFKPKFEEDYYELISKGTEVSVEEFHTLVNENDDTFAAYENELKQFVLVHKRMGIATPSGGVEQNYYYRLEGISGKDLTFRYKTYNNIGDAKTVAEATKDEQKIEFSVNFKDINSEIQNHRSVYRGNGYDIISVFETYGDKKIQVEGSLVSNLTTKSVLNKDIFVKVPAEDADTKYLFWVKGPDKEEYYDLGQIKSLFDVTFSTKGAMRIGAKEASIRLGIRQGFVRQLEEKFGFKQLPTEVFQITLVVNDKNGVRVATAMIAELLFAKEGFFKRLGRSVKGRIFRAKRFK